MPKSHMFNIEWNMYSKYDNHVRFYKQHNGEGDYMTI